MVRQRSGCKIMVPESLLSLKSEITRAQVEWSKLNFYRRVKIFVKQSAPSRLAILTFHEGARKFLQLSALHGKNRSDGLGILYTSKGWTVHVLQRILPLFVHRLFLPSSLLILVPSQSLQKFLLEHHLFHQLNTRLMLFSFCLSLLIL